MTAAADGRNSETSWTIVAGAARGDAGQRAEFARRYATAIRSYLASRWRGSALARSVDDAVQEVLLECLRPGGALEGLGEERVDSFRAYLYGVTRNVARALERGAARGDVDLASTFEVADEAGPTPSVAFERAWARALMREAAELQRSWAAADGEAALRGVKILQLRFEEDLPVRDIAALLGIDAARTHREYANARKMFRSALEAVLKSHFPGSAGDLTREWERLRSLLSD